MSLNQQPENHRHVCEKKKIVELHDHHLVFRERIRCVIKDCKYQRDPRVEIHSLRGIIDKRTKKPRDTSRESLRKLEDDERKK